METTTKHHARSVKHTPTPWELPNGTEANKFGTYRISESPNGGVHLANIALVGNLADAEFIVRAVNSHEALLESAKKMLAYFRAQDPGMPFEDWEVTQGVEDAIAKAEGK